MVRAALIGLAGALVTAACARDEPPAAVVDSPAAIVGAARVTDGDTILVAGVRVRLHAIDAPEVAQRCTGRGGVTIACGEMARSALVGLIGEMEVRCDPRNRDRYGRVVAVCQAGGRDLGRELVQLGWARAFTHYGRDYAADEDAARAARRGFWGGEWQAPAEWRRGR